MAQTPGCVHSVSGKSTETFYSCPWPTDCSVGGIFQATIAQHGACTIFATRDTTTDGEMTKSAGHSKKEHVAMQLRKKSPLLNAGSKQSILRHTNIKFLYQCKH